MSERSPPDAMGRRYEEAAEWFFRLHDENQSPEQIEQWIEWCCRDPANQQAFEHLMPLWQVRSAMPQKRGIPVPAAATALTATVATLGVGTVTDHRRRWSARRWSLTALAAAVTVAAVGVGWRLQSERTLQLGAVASLSSDRAQARSAQLADGSHLALGAQSRVTVNFADRRRDIEIERGEAFFNVEHDRTRPFVVHAGALQVVAVGTAFDVDRRGGRVSVTVQEGVVEISAQRAEGSATATPQRVASGSQLIYDENSAGAPTLRVIDPSAADAWRRGRFEYESEPLSAIIEDLNRYSRAQIVLQDARVATMRYTGTIDVALINEWLRALPSIFDIRVQFDTDRQVTLSAPIRD